MDEGRLIRLALHFALGFPVAMVYSNLWEWFLHKVILHGFGRSRRNFWFYHWKEHHGVVNHTDGYDENYTRVFRAWNGPTKEYVQILGMAALHLPLWSVAPGFVAGVVFCALEYLYKHTRSHLDPEWLREKLPWHWDHHFGDNPDANWCLTRPWMDDLLGTRIVVEPRIRREARSSPPRDRRGPAA